MRELAYLLCELRRILDGTEVQAKRVYFAEQRTEGSGVELQHFAAHQRLYEHTQDANITPLARGVGLILAAVHAVLNESANA